MIRIGGSRLEWAKNCLMLPEVTFGIFPYQYLEPLSIVMGVSALHDD